MPDNLTSNSARPADRPAKDYMAEALSERTHEAYGRWCQHAKLFAANSNRLSQQNLPEAVVEYIAGKSDACLSILRS